MAERAKLIQNQKNGTLMKHLLLYSNQQLLTRHAIDRISTPRFAQNFYDTLWNAVGQRGSIIFSHKLVVYSFL
jgi:hypothetical protein